MQVFIPFTEHKESVGSLDNSRLIKQALEATQILDVILGVPTLDGKPRTGWVNHPAVIMWKKYPQFLISYLEANILELKRRGIKTTYAEKKLASYIKDEIVIPVWWGDDKVHKSHRYRLLQKPLEEFLKRGSWDKTSVNWYLGLKWDELEEDFLSYEYEWPAECDGSYILQRKATKLSILSKQKIKDLNLDIAMRNIRES